MTYPMSEPLEGRVLWSLTFPDSVDGSAFDFQVTKATGIFKGEKSLHMELADGDFVITGDDARAGYYNFIRPDRRSGGGLSLYPRDDNADSLGLGLDFQTLVRGVYHGAFTLDVTSDSVHEGSRVRGTFTAAPTDGRGAVQGTVFDDHDADGKIDTYELGTRGATLWADLNDNGVYDRREPRTFSNARGQYLLKDVPAAWQRTIRVAGQTGWDVLAPSANGRTVSVLKSDTAVSPVHFSIGHDAYVGGVVFKDNDADRQFSAPDNAAGLIGTRVWADLDNDRRVDAGEPVAWVSTGGRYLLHADIPAGTPVRVETTSTILLPRKRAYVFATTATRTTKANFLIG